MIVGLGVAGILGTSAVLWRSRPTGNRQLPTTIAVLPFAPLIGGSGDEALELGMADTLINRLSVLPGVVVTPFSSVRRYAGINQNPVSAGRELAVAAVIEGHVQVRHDRVRLTARLLRVADGSALWSGSFDERLSDFFSVQDLLAQQLVDALALDVPDAARRRLVRNFTDDVEAWQLYLNGRYHWDTRMTEDGLRRAREYYEAASRLDPGFALPVVGLADVWAVLGVFGIVPPVEAFTSAMEAARRAIGLDAKLAEAHASLGHSLTQFERDWRGGERLYRYALSLKPSYGQAMMWLANNQLFQGHLRKALEDGRHAQLLEPASLTFAANVGMIDYFLRDYAAADETTHEARGSRTGGRPATATSRARTARARRWQSGTGTPRRHRSVRARLVFRPRPCVCGRGSGRRCTVGDQAPRGIRPQGVWRRLRHRLDSHGIARAGWRTRRAGAMHRRPFATGRFHQCRAWV